MMREHDKSIRYAYCERELAGVWRPFLGGHSFSANPYPPSEKPLSERPGYPFAMPVNDRPNHHDRGQ